MRKPPNLVYGVDDRPPAPVLWLSGAQHVAIVSIFLVYPLVLAREGGVSDALALDMVSLTMLAMAAGSLVHTLRCGRIGAGLLLPTTLNSNFLAPCVLALKAGGFPMIVGMTLFAAAVQVLLARVQHRLRGIFTSEIVGLAVLLIGLNIATIGARYFFAPPADEAVRETHYGVAVGTLALMVGLSVWGSTGVRLFCAVIGIVAGYAAAVAFDLLPAADRAGLLATPLFGAPHLGHLGIAFDVGLALPFALAAVATSLRGIGIITTAQRANDDEWVRPDQRSLERGLLADAASTATAGVLGTIAVNASPTAVGTATATGVTSRVVGYAVAAILALLAFMPRLAAVFTWMPAAVMSAALLFSAAFVIVSGFQIISSRMLDARRTFVIGLSLTAFLAVEMRPGELAALSPNVQPAFANGLVTGMLVALVLVVLFRIARRERRTMTITSGAQAPHRLEAFMDECGAAWGARRDVMSRATFNLLQATETLRHALGDATPIEVVASFDELRLEVRLRYVGEPIDLPERRPSAEEVMASDAGERRLAGYLLRASADRVGATVDGEHVTLVFGFVH